MAIQVDGQRLRPASQSCGFLANHLRVVRSTVAEMRHLCVVKCCGPVRANHLDTRTERRSTARCGLDNAHSAALETHYRNQPVLRLHFVAHGASFGKLHLCDTACQPAQVIEGVYSLIGKHTPVQTPRPSPPCTVIVGLVAPPFHIGATGKQTPEATFPDGVRNDPRTAKRAPLEDAGNSHAGTLGRIHQGFRARRDEIEGLFAQHMETMLNSHEPLLSMQPGRRADVHGVNEARLAHGLQIVERCRTKLPGYVGSSLPNAVTDCGYSCAV